MSSPPSEDPVASFDFLSEFLLAIDFGEGFRFDEPFSFDDSGDGISMIATGGSPSYGAYDNDSPTLAFQCITDYNRRIIGIYGPQFGTRNDKEIVKVDPNVHHIRHDGTRMSRGNITHTMAESKKSEVRIIFATMDIITCRIRFPPTQMQIVLHLRGTSQ